MRPASRRFVLDILLLVGMIAVALHKVTGDLIHEWLSILLIPLLLLHLLWNWEVIWGTAKQWTNPRFPKRQKFNFVWNILLYTCMGVVMLSGILISRDFLPRLGILIPNDGFMSYIHKRSIFVLYMMLGIHLGMHWNWIWQIAKRRKTKKEGKES
ncbi:MAG: DUF4405 domain-containing protein [Planctomycetia bacterium]|nr:DUF4405 domain-containing protein [Planctomycetia bacterium]